MPSANVRMPVPLVRFNTLFPGQFGVQGTANETGLRDHCTGTIFYVDPNYTGVVDNRDGTDPLAPLATIGAALTKCQAYRGDVIAVMANDAWQFGSGASYPIAIMESVTVTVPGVSIVGVSPSGALGVVWYPAADGGTAITVAATDVLIEGFCFTARPASIGAERAIYSAWNGTTLFGDNMMVRNCYFGDGINVGVQLEYAWNCYIEHCVFQETVAAAIYVDPLGSGAADLRIADCWFRDCAAAMSLQGCDASEIIHNRIWNADAHAAGAATDEGIDLLNGDNNIIADNWFSCLLPVPAAGDWDDLNTDNVPSTNAWVGNHCENGLAVTSPT